MGPTVGVAQVIKEAIYDAFYKLTDSRSQITAYVFDVVRASVPRMDLDEIFVVRLNCYLVTLNIIVYSSYIWSSIMLYYSL